MPVDYSALKKGGFMKQSQKDYFALRLKVVAGKIGAQQLPKISEVAQKYGKGYIHLTTRQGIEIPFIHLDNIEAVKAELATVGLVPGVCGPRVRTVCGCQGTTLCPHGLIDAETIAVAVDQRYYGRELPHKFKFAITGCINACAEPQENDFGIMGVVEPVWEGADTCSQCGLCAETCRYGCISMDEKGVHFDRSCCVLCGDCIKMCPMDCWKPGRIGYTIIVGGRIGRQPGLGRELTTVWDEASMWDIMDRSLEFFVKHGKSGERFGAMLGREGWDKFRKEVLQKA